SIMAALLPIASGLEEGSELLKSAAVGLIGGLLTSTLLTLVFVPAMYTVFDDIQSLVRRLFGQAPRTHGEAGHPTPTDGADGHAQIPLPDGLGLPPETRVPAG